MQTAATDAFDGNACSPLSESVIKNGPASCITSAGSCSSRLTAPDPVRCNGLENCCAHCMQLHVAESLDHDLNSRYLGQHSLVLLDIGPQCGEPGHLRVPGRPGIPQFVQDPVNLTNQRTKADSVHAPTCHTVEAVVVAGVVVGLPQFIELPDCAPNGSGTAPGPCCNLADIEPAGKRRLR